MLSYYQTKGIESSIYQPIEVLEKTSVQNLLRIGAKVVYSYGN